MTKHCQCARHAIALNISREVLSNSGLRGYRPLQAEILYQQRAQASRNALQIDPVTRQLVAERLSLQWSSE